MGSNNRHYLVIAGGVVAVIAIVIATLYILGGRSTEPGNNFLARLQNGLSSVTGTLTPAQIAEAPDFVFRRLDIDTTKPQAEACLVFTRNLDASGRTHYEDYFSVDPETRVASHVVDNRRMYREKFARVLELLRPSLDLAMPEGAFYLWLPTPTSDTEFARSLHANYNVTVLPGSYLARAARGVNPGRNFVRVALVPPLEACLEGAERIRAHCLSIGQQRSAAG